MDLPVHINFVNNPHYADTNYIYSIYCAREYLDDDIVLMHGDLVFEYSVLEDIVNNPVSAMKVSSTLPLPQKDFKAVIMDGMVMKVGVDFFNECMEAQPLYKLERNAWEIWLNKIKEYCERGEKNVSCRTDQGRVRSVDS